MILRPLMHALLAALALTIGACATPRLSEKVDGAAAVPLVNTQWRLANLGGRVLTNPAGPAAMMLQLQAGNPRITGFAGCNRLFGGYLLDGNQLRFEQVGATRMACVDESRMRLEQDYFQMLGRVASWKIQGSSLQLSDAGGSLLATFVASEALAAQ